MHQKDLEIRFKLEDKIIIEILQNNKVQKETHTNNLQFLNSLKHDRIQDIKELLNEGHKIHLGKEDSYCIIKDNPEILI